jgi:hypothetical protein
MSIIFCADGSTAERGEMHLFARRSVPLGLAAALLVAALLYLPTLRSGFVYDDLWYLVRNPAVRSLHVAAFFRDPQTAAAPESGLSGDVYRPLETLAFALAYKGWGLRTWPYHLAAVLLHLLNGVLFWKVLNKLLKNTAAAVFGAAAFLLHPVQVQTVAWVSQLPGLVGAAGFLAALNYGVADRNLSVAEWIVGWLAFTVAVLSKETVVILPLLVWVLRDRRYSDRRQYLGGLTVIAVAYLAGRLIVLHHLSQFSEGHLYSADSLILGLLAFPVYLGKMAFPTSLRVSYG